MPYSFATHSAGQLIASADVNAIQTAVTALGAGVVSVVDKGAKGDGTTDDTAAFQTAINAARGGKLVIPAPASFYRLTDTLAVTPASGTQVFLDIEAHGPNGSIRFETPNKPVFHTYGWKHSTIDGVKVQLTNAAANAIVWEVDGDGTYVSSGELTWANCLCEFGTGGNGVGWRFGATGGDRDFSVNTFRDCQVTGQGTTYGDVAVQNASLNGHTWLFASCGFSGIHTGYTDTAPLVTLNGGIDAVVTTIALNDVTDLPLAVLPSAGEIQVDSERITYTGKSAGSLTGCTRGAHSTTAATHSTGASVRQYLGSNGPAGGASMTFANQTNTALQRDFVFSTGGDNTIVGGRFENGKRLVHMNAGSAPIDLNVACTIADYTPSDEIVFKLQHPGSARLHIHPTRPSGSAYTAAFVTFNHALNCSLVGTGSWHAADPPYTVGSATVAHDLSKAVRLSAVNTVAAVFAA